ncbi:MAG: copper-binding protein [Deltaproteobacteria bacterium]|nr:copper-binding protein [Deltaproteobacteria bacterium]
MNVPTACATLLATLTLAAALSTFSAPEASAADEVISGTGKVNAVMAAERKINLTHDPIPALGWPGLTMDFKLSDSVKLEGIDVGDTVRFTLRKADGGMYEIDSLSESGG